MTHIQQRRDDSAIWTLDNPVLYDGEMGHEKDTGKSKMGDGVTPWNALPYLRGVHSVAGKTGDVELGMEDVPGAAPLNSPAFTGNPTAPTPDINDLDSSVATTAFVKFVVADMVSTALAAMKDEMHPVDSLYFTTTDTNPGTFLGGTWEAWGSGRVPVGVDDNDPQFWDAEQMGGFKYHRLTPEQTAKIAHSHGVNDPGHAHGVNVGYSELGTHNWQLKTSTIPDDPDGRELNLFTGTSTGASGTGISINPSPSSDADETFDLLQPYITCYMWKRTA